MKPPHFDEGINGWFTDQISSLGFYRYDPSNYHGPLHFYLLYVFKFFFGHNLWALRMVPVLFGVGSVYLIICFRPYLGRLVSNGAAFLVAISPAMVFYSRYSIHEVELVFFSLLALLGFFRYQTVKDKWALWQINLALAGMILTKETFFIHIITFLISLGILKIYEKFSPALDKPRSSLAHYTRSEWWLALVIPVIVVITFYSGFFRNWAGVTGLFKMFVPWFNTGFAVSGHNKPFWYWLSLFWRYEWAALAGLFLLPTLLVRSFYFIRIVGLYGFGCFLAYSIINYKTPWCVIHLIWPFCMVLISFLARKKWMTMAGLGLLSVAALAKTLDLNFIHYTDEKEPYVYVQTYNDIVDILQKVETVSPKKDLRINLFLSSDWPLPWMLAGYSNTGYLGIGGVSLTQNVDAALILAEAHIRKILESKMKKEYFVQTFRMRGAMGSCYAYFDKQVFKDFFSQPATVFKPLPKEPLTPGSGLRAHYYANAEWTGKAVLTQTMGEVDFDWKETERPLPPPFGIIFSGEIFIPQENEILFSLTSDDGSDLKIDNQEIVNNLGIHAIKRVERSVRLKQGWHTVQVRYNDFGGGMVAGLRWKWAGQIEETIPAKNFRYSSNTKK